MKKLVFAFAAFSAAAIAISTALTVFGEFLKQEDPFDVWGDADDFDYEQAVLDWEEERYEQDMRDLENDE